MLSVILEPASRTIQYLEATSIRAKLRNGFAEPVSIQTVSGILRYWIGSDDRTMDYGVELGQRQIAAGAEAHIILNVDPDPILPPYTVTLELSVAFQRYDGQWLPGEGPLPIAGFGSVIVSSRRPAGARVFISFKDPENERIAFRLQEFLGRVGLEGYIAKEDRQIGTPIWDEKISRAIGESRALAVLWTREAAATPTGVEREMRIAEEQNVPIMLCRERGAELPRGYNPEVEYASLSAASLDESLAQFCRCIFIALARRSCS